MLKLKELNNTAQLVKMFIDNTPIAYIIMDRNHRIHYVNKSFENLRGLDMATTIGDKCYNISNGGMPCGNCAVAEALSSGKRAFISRKDRMPDGSVRFIDDYAIPLQLDANGQVEYVLEIMINRTAEMLAREQRNMDYDEILSILSALLDTKDNYTAAHSESVRRLSLNLAKSMGLPADRIFEISVAASLHDIGKVNVPLSILNKPDKLTNEEYDVIKMHPIHSFNMLEGFSSFGDIRDIALHHHERIDGRGYPDGLTGDELSIGAKIVAVADTYDAITSTRSYRHALSHEYAIAEIQRVSGSQLDSQVVSAFLAMDFNNLSKELYAPYKENALQVERVVHHTQATVAAELENFKLADKIDMDHLFKEIFKSTPCGYVIMTTDKKVIFASDYFLDYMGLTKDEVFGQVCYEAGGVGTAPCKDCAIERAIISGKTEYMRQEHHTASGERVFDLFGVPLPEEDGTIEYVIEIVIDRLEETRLERARSQDFNNLIGMLGGVFEAQKQEIDERELSDEIVALKSRLSRIMAKTVD